MNADILSFGCRFNRKEALAETLKEAGVYTVPENELVKFKRQAERYAAWADNTLPYVLFQICFGCVTVSFVACFFVAIQILAVTNPPTWMFVLLFSGVVLCVGGLVGLCHLLDIKRNVEWCKIELASNNITCPKLADLVASHGFRVYELHLLHYSSPVAVATFVFVEDSGQKVCLKYKKCW